MASSPKRTLIVAAIHFLMMAIAMPGDSKGSSRLFASLDGPVSTLDPASVDDMI
jgi:hypothetical protein